MKSAIRKPLQIALATMLGVGVLFANEHHTQFGTGPFVSEAGANASDALTPMSYAGVAPADGSPAPMAMASRASMAHPSMVRLWSMGLPRMRLPATKRSMPTAGSPPVPVIGFAVTPKGVFVFEGASCK